MNPLISIIIPVYNTEKYLRRCLDSIIAQTYKDFECILVDDGSTDNSGKICEEYASKDVRFKVFHKENGGVSSARNLGLEQIKGEYVTFCDSDDSTNSDWLSVFIEGIVNSDLVVASFNIKKLNGNTERRIFPYQIQDIDLLWSILLMCNSAGMLWHKCFKTSIIKSNKICFNEKYKFCEDEEFVSHYAMFVHKTKIYPNTTYNYYAPNYSSKWQDALQFDTIYDIYEHTLKIISINGQLKNSYIFILNRMLACIKRMYYCKKYRRALNCLKTIQTIVEDNSIDFHIQKVNRFYFQKHIKFSHLIYISLSAIRKL